jgi:hypothetical protein
MGWRTIQQAFAFLHTHTKGMKRKAASQPAILTHNAYSAEPKNGNDLYLATPIQGGPVATTWLFCHRQHSALTALLQGCQPHIARLGPYLMLLPSHLHASGHGCAPRSHASLVVACALHHHHPPATPHTD